MEYAPERNAVAYWTRRIYRRGLTTSTGGNLSCRAGADRVLLTPGSIDKARIRGGQVAILDLHGQNLTPELRPSSEAPMHLAIYRRLSDVGAVVHAHPVTASAFACSETHIDIGLLGETYALLDTPILAPYALSGTDELAEIVAECAQDSSCILLQNHAVLTTGKDLEQAFQRLELLEEAARVTLVARQLEGVRRLSLKERADLDRLIGRTVPGTAE